MRLWYACSKVTVLADALLRVIEYPTVVRITEHDKSASVAEGWGL